MKKLAVCECCGNIFMMGDRVWKYRGDKLCSEECARKAEFLGKQGKWKNDIDKKEKENKKMKEIKLTIDGKEVQLTEEQLKMLGIEPEKKRKNPFEEPRFSQDYYFTNECGIGKYFYYDKRDYDYGKLRNVANVFTNKHFAEQVAFHQLLYRQLLKFAYDNECEDTAEWDGKNAHWVIRYNNNRNEFCSYCQDGYKARDVYFSSKEGAERAIKEVVEPFVKEHPEFVW